jgi:hypothetical protein
LHDPVAEKVFSAAGDCHSNHIAFLRRCLAKHGCRYLIGAMGRCRALRRNSAGLHLAALYSAFAVIAAVVLGTLSVHPF